MCALLTFALCATAIATASVMVYSLADEEIVSIIIVVWGRLAQLVACTTGKAEPQVRTSSEPLFIIECSSPHVRRKKVVAFW